MNDSESRARTEKVVRTVTRVGGAVLGGKIGSLAGPFGTIAGSAAGRRFGDWVGRKLCE